MISIYVFVMAVLVFLGILTIEYIRVHNLEENILVLQHYLNIYIEKYGAPTIGESTDFEDKDDPE